MTAGSPHRARSYRAGGALCQGRPTTRLPPSDRLQHLREPCRVRRVARRQHSFDLLSSIHVDADGIQSFAASIAAPDLSPGAPTPGFTEGDIAYGGSDRLIDPVVTQAMPSRPPSSSGAHLDTGADQPRREQTNTAAVMSANVDPHPPSSIPTARTRIIAPARP